MTLSIAVRKPLQDVLDDIRGVDPDDPTLVDRLESISLNLATAIASVVEGLDEDNREEDLAALQDELDAVLREAMSRLKLGPGARMISRFVIPTITSQLDALTLPGTRIDEVGLQISRVGLHLDQVGQTLQSASRP